MIRRDKSCNEVLLDFSEIFLDFPSRLLMIRDPFDNQLINIMAIMMLSMKLIAESVAVFLV
jgi:hypothetical protein